MLTLASIHHLVSLYSNGSLRSSLHEKKYVLELGIWQLQSEVINMYLYLGR